MTNPNGTSDATPGPHFPRGLHHAFLFASFNALSFQIILSSPMILYAKTLGASATVLGIISGMMPLLVIFQIPAASHIPRHGYKKFVFAGWGTRVMFIGVMSLVPLTGRFLGRPSQLAVMLSLLFAFNLSRGISSCAWLPWISSLVPAQIRGKYLVRDAACVNMGSFLTFVFAAFVLGQQPAPWQFAVIFAFSAATGGVSLFFLKRIPDVDVPEHQRTGTGPVPWKEISQFPPFRKLLWECWAWALAYGGLGAFTIAFLKSETGMIEEGILIAASAAFLGGFASLWFIGSRLDSFGSKPVLTLASLLWIVISIGWLLLAGKALAANRPMVLVLELLMGLGASLINMSNTRLAMMIVPPMGRDHFFALYSVILNATLGIAPIIWGVVIDALRGFDVRAGGLDWNRFSIFFGLVACCFAALLIACRRLEEPAAARTDQLFLELFYQSPRRIWLRLWPRH